VALTLRELGTTAAKEQRLDDARGLLQSSLVIRQALKDPDPHEEAATLHQLAVVETQQAKGSKSALRQAEILLERALTLETGDLEQAALAMQLGRIALRRGELPRADDCFSKALNAYVKVTRILAPQPQPRPELGLNLVLTWTQGLWYACSQTY